MIPPDVAPVVEGRKLDRLVQFDERSRQFSAVDVLDAERERRTLSPRSYTWGTYAVLDQGPNGACVGFAWTGELMARPVVINGMNSGFAFSVYRDAQRVDEWPGEDYEGTSVLAGSKVVQSRGFQDGYRWAFGGNDELVLVVGYTGPVVLGTAWYSGMFTPDRSGVIRPTGTVEGGHAILVKGVSIARRLYRLQNSWGAGWGVGGDCFVSFDDMDRLRSEDGEVCVPQGRHRAPAAAVNTGTLGG